MSTTRSLTVAPPGCRHPLYKCMLGSQPPTPPPPLDRMTDRRVSKHYLSATSFADDKSKNPKGSKNNFQTSKKIFAFTFAFAWYEQAIRRTFWMQILLAMIAYSAV